MNGDYQQLDQITLSHIYLDTNVLIDTFDKPGPLHEVFEKLKNQENILLTINSVLIEFLKGSRSIVEYNKKQDFINNIISSVYTITSDIEESALKICAVFGNLGGSISPTDFYLAALMMKFKSNNKVYVMTKDHKAFPTSIFDRLVLVNIENERDVQTFGFYKFDSKKYSAELVKITKL